MVLALTGPSDPDSTEEFTLPAGAWRIVLDASWVRPPVPADRAVVSGSVPLAAPGFCVLAPAGDEVPAET